MSTFRSPHIQISHLRTEQPDASQFERHCHNGYELLFVLQGEGVYIVEGTQYPMRPNTLMLLRPLEYHYVRPQKTSPYERYVVSFDAAAPIDAAAHLSILNTAKIKSRGIYFTSEALLKNILTVLQMPKWTNEFSPDGTVTAKGETMLRTVVTQALILLSSEKVAENEASSNGLVSDVIDYLNRHLTEAFSLDRLAQAFFISKYHLCHIFRQYTGMPVMSYLNTKRIALAQQLIGEGRSASETAALVGFQDYSSFYRAYRKQTGHSPAWTRN